jgi:predicted phosphodiesterase
MQVLVIAVVIISGLTVSVFLSRILIPPRTGVSFYVFGDSQGYQGGLTEIARDANQERPDFVFHCGDLTPFGQENQYLAVLKAMSAFQVPVYTAVGNHDMREGGSVRYLEHFGPASYSFDIWSAHFTVFNTSTGDVDESEMEWLEQDLSQSEAEFKFVFTHIPPFDPRPSQNHTLTNTTTAERLVSLFESHKVNTVFSGHIHMYNVSVRNGVRYVISGGAGASLHATTEEGGIYHYVSVTVDDSGVSIDARLLDTPSWERDTVVITGHSDHVTLTLEDLLSLDVLERVSSFQNQLLNWRGHGTYRGVRISDLVEVVGGFNPNDTVRVTSFDGFAQDFCQGNVYPNASWFEIQGDMILAFEFNGTSVPDWTDGMRIVMLPGDEAYSIEDCVQTSAPGMGCDVYPSGGARWVRFVSRIEVIAES